MLAAINCASGSKNGYKVHIAQVYFFISDK